MSCKNMSMGLKYCGGCNPRFDRVAAARELGFGEAPAAEPGVRYDTLLIICGCTARCADLSGLEAERTVMVSTLKELEEARALLCCSE